MSDAEFISRYNSFPEHIRQKIKELVDQLFMKERTAGKELKNEPQKIRQAGCGKGIFSYIPDAKEFNKPLDDFKDYM